MRSCRPGTIEEAGIPGMVLMENAGRGVAGEILWEYPRISREQGGRCCGKGERSAATRFCHRPVSHQPRARGAGVSSRFTRSAKGYQGEPDSPADEGGHPGSHRTGCLEGGAAGTLSLRAGGRCRFGTGLSSTEVTTNWRRKSLTRWTEGITIMSVDLPSGCALPGEVLGTCVKAACTVTFGLPKAGGVGPPGRTMPEG